MIRQPTSREDALRWWREALAGNMPKIHEGDVQAGFFRMKGKHGPRRVRIELHSEVDESTGELTAPETYVCWVDGRQWQKPPDLSWLTPITVAQYSEMERLQELEGADRFAPPPTEDWR